MDNVRIENIKVEDLHFDFHNPRLAEFNITAQTPEEEILKILWEAMSVEEIVLSIASSGFFQHEPLIAINAEPGRQDTKVVIEGNRRLAAVKAILNPRILEPYQININRLIQITPEIQQHLAELPVITVENREAAWKYIGFKHINGPAKWGSYAKAQYIAQIHRNFGVPLNSIATQIGDTHKTVQKLYQGLMVIEQAEDRRVFDKSDIKGSRLYFSHLYTGLNYEGVKSFLGLSDVSEETANPVPADKIEDAGIFLTWLFGSARKDIEPVIRSQNPDLRRLDSVLKNKGATISLKGGASLNAAYEISQPGEDVFEQSIVSAKESLQKAHSFVTLGYKGEREPLEIVRDIAQLADDLFKIMKGKYDEKNNPTAPKRTI